MRKLLLVLLLLGTAGGSGWLWYRARRPPLLPPPTKLELDNLIKRRDALNQRFLDLTLRKDDQGLKDAPRGGIMIGVPTSFTRAIVEQVVTGLFGETTLTLKNLKVHKDDDVKAKMLFRKKTVGKVNLDVDIHQVTGVLKPGKPELTFERDRIRVRLPVRLAEGRGDASIHMQWDSKGLAANAVCGDEDVTKQVDGTVAPEDYVVEGSFGVAAQGESVILTPDFGELAVRITVVPSEAAWKAVDEVVAGQRAGCRAVLDKIDIKGILGRLVGKGFNVKIPSKIFKPLRLPAGVESSLKLQGVNLDLHVKPAGLVVTPQRIWYGADIEARWDRTPAQKPPAVPSPPAG